MARHGTLTRYDAGCSCERCRAAQARYRRAWRRRHTTRPFAPVIWICDLCRTLNGRDRRRCRACGLYRLGRRGVTTLAQ
jgi:hypothetical protein